MLDSIITGTTTLPILLICTAASLVLGLAIAGTFMFKNHYSKGFASALIILPAVVQLIIMLVNGNVGAGVAIAGAFSLVRFRSAPGGARDICAIFLAMAVGIATGMGYIGIAVIFTVIIGGVTLLLAAVDFGNTKKEERELKITIPENLDYDGLFDDIFQKYTDKAELERVKTTNMGSLYELYFRVTLKDAGISKKFLDELRCRNGNLNIICGRISTDNQML